MEDRQTYIRILLGTLSFNKKMGIIFGDVLEKSNRNYFIKSANSDDTILLPYQRATLPLQVSPFVKTIIIAGR